MTTPAFVFAGFGERKKILVRFLATPRRLEPGMTVADVVEYGIENQPHFPSLQFADQLLQCLLAAKLRINGEEVGRIVLVVRRGDEDRCQVECRHPEILDVIEMVDDPGQIAAEEILP